MGGLTVRVEIAKRLPNESLIYFGDGLNVPYGARSRAEITKFASAAIEILLEKGAKMVVVACNAATGAAIETLRARFTDIPIVGMEPAVKPAALSTKTGTIGVLATHAALTGELFKRTAAGFRGKVKIVEAVGEGFVELVENETVSSPEALETVRRIVRPMLAVNVDRIVLGCTHYPYLLPVMRQVIDEWRAENVENTESNRNTGETKSGIEVEIVDAAPAIAKRVDNLLAINDLYAAPRAIPTHDFMSFAGDTYAARLKEHAAKLKTRP